MKISNLVIAAIWIYLLADSWLQGRELPELMNRVPLPEVSQLFISVFLAIVFLLSLWITFWQRHTLMEDLPLITRSVDRRFGAGTYRNFLHRFRPIGISILSGLILGTVGTWSTYASTRSQAAYLISWIFLAAALGLLLALVVSHRHPPALR